MHALVVEPAIAGRALDHLVVVVERADALSVLISARFGMGVMAWCRSGWIVAITFAFGELVLSVVDPDRSWCSSLWRCWRGVGRTSRLCVVASSQTSFQKESKGCICVASDLSIKASVMSCVSR